MHKHISIKFLDICQEQTGNIEEGSSAIFAHPLTLPTHVGIRRRTLSREGRGNEVPLAMAAIGIGCSMPLAPCPMSAFASGRERGRVPRFRAVHAQI